MASCQPDSPDDSRLLDDNEPNDDDGPTGDDAERDGTGQDNERSRVDNGDVVLARFLFSPLPLPYFGDSAAWLLCFALDAPILRTRRPGSSESLNAKSNVFPAISCGTFGPQRNSVTRGRFPVPRGTEGDEEEEDAGEAFDPAVSVWVTTRRGSVAVGTSKGLFWCGVCDSPK